MSKLYLYNYHTHCNYCDGNGSIEDFIISAIEKKMKILGFSSHAALPFETDWTMKAGNFEKYKSDLNQLKIKYKDKIKILLGLETDYIPGLISPDKSYKNKMGLDYLIGSIHFLGRLKNGIYWTIDGSYDEIKNGIEENFNGNVRKACEYYYELLGQMIDSCKPDIIGHFDLIKKNNQGNRLFMEDENWYKKLYEKALIKAADSNCIIEINTGGIVRKKIDSFYPSNDILKRCLELNIPITINSDAHYPEHINGYFENAVKNLIDIGFKKIFYLTETEKHEFIIN